jgi:hypothetical protein
MPEMHLIEDSPDVIAVGYDPDLRELHVRFADETGDTWIYHEVPQELFIQLMEAKSKGRFIDELAEAGYRATKLVD